LVPSALIGLLADYLPAYTDRIGFWTLDGDAIRWLGVVLFAVGGSLRIWPVFGCPGCARTAICQRRSFWQGDAVKMTRQHEAERAPFGGAERMRNIVWVPALLLALSAANASAEDLSKLKVDSTRFALEAYDEELVPEDRKRLENWIGGCSWDSCGQM
jgi:hypothetical protein